MNRRIEWPDGKRFAFAILDDTDNCFVHNVKPVYELLRRCNILGTKSVWVYPPRDGATGASLQDSDYLEFVRGLLEQGFEIALHGVGSGRFTRDEIQAGLEEYKRLLGEYPRIHVNHSRNPDNLYWGYKRFAAPFSWLFRLSRKQRIFTGDEPDSEHFWGDLAKKHIRYTRNLVFNGVNTYRYDPKMPYRVGSRDACSNYWFSSADGQTIAEFRRLLRESNIDALERGGGFCIVYTHFSAGFVDEDGEVDSGFERRIWRLAEREGWFVPVGQLLDYLLTMHNDGDFAAYPYLLKVSTIWILQRIAKRLRFGR